jgi:hypothetical protein
MNGPMTVDQFVDRLDVLKRGQVYDIAVSDLKHSCAIVRRLEDIQSTHQCFGIIHTMILLSVKVKMW